MASSTIGIRLDAEEKAFFSDYAKTFGESLSEFFLKAARERAEDELDARIAEAAWAEFEKDPVSYTQDEVEKMFA